ncbi:MAG TPA: DUF2339 domain-containing protein [Longimicrobium sp.]|nr:DUF2339 domain-containing protein [Longimicrobium sp.]
MATAEDLHLLQSAGAAFARLVQEPAPPPAPAAARELPPMPPAAPPRAAARPRPPFEVYDQVYDDDLVPGPRRRERVVEPTAAERWIAARMKATPGDWIARAGMALLLFGVAFLCKYSIDQGWVTPALRVAAGAAVGAALIVLGVRTHRNARAFSGLFLGGGIGAWYTATFAAYALYHLVPFPVAFALMAATTAAAFGLALWSGIETLAVVAALGGIGTPFVLSTGHASVPGFVAYLMCILGWTSGTYLARRWRVSFAVATGGTWMALMAPLEALPAGGAAAGARTALTVGFVAVLLAGWSVFLLPRAWPARFQPSPREEAAHAWWARAMSVTAERVRTAEGYLAVAASFFVVWMSVGALWELSARAGGYLGLGVVAVTALAYAALRTRLPALARAHAFAGAAAGAASLALVSRNVPEAVMALVVYGALLHAGVRRERLGRPTRLLAHVVMALAATAAAQALVTPGDLASRLALLSVAGCAYAVAAKRVSGVGRPLRDVYRLGGHAFVALLLWALSAPLPHTGAWLAVSLAAFAAALCWLERQPRSAPVPGRPVDGAAALALHVVALVTVLGFCGPFGSGAFAWLNPRAGAELALIGSLAAGAVLAPAGRRRWGLAGAGYALWLWTAADQFDGLTGAAAFTTGVWAATGLILLLAALRRREQGAVRVAIGTLALVCAKLFLVDLASLDPIWRILVFLGVGAAFLGVSYAVRTAWLPAPPPEPDPPAGVSLAGH